MNPALLDKLEELPRLEKVNPAYQNGKRIHNALCPCCGGDSGIRAAFRKTDNAKPKYKKHRVMKLREAKS